MARTFHFVGNEDFHFTSFGETSVDTTVGHYRANFTRCGLRAADGNSGWATPDLGGLTDFWFHARVWMQEKYPNNAFTLPGTVLSPIQFVDAAGIIRLTVVFPVLSRITNTNAIDWRFAKFDAAGTMTFLGPPFSATFTGSPTTPDAVDIQIGNYAVPGAGFVKIYFNGTLGFSVAGVTLSTDGTPALAGVRMCGTAPDFMGSPGSSVKWPHVWSEVMVAVEDTRGLELATLIPNGAGNVTNWDTGTFGDINELTLDDLTTNTSGTAGQVQQYTVSGPPPGSYGVAALCVAARAQRGSLGGPANLGLGVRTGGADYWAPDIPLPITKQHVAAIFTVNPATGVAFTVEELAAAGFNIGMKSAT